MSFTPRKDKQHAITLKSPAGNIVGHINLAPQFLKAITGKRIEDVTVNDVNNINDGHLMAYLSKMTIDITDPSAITKVSNIDQY